VPEDRPFENRFGAEPLLMDSGVVVVAVVVRRILDLLSEAERRERRAEGEQAEQRTEKCRGSTSSPIVPHGLTW
jgi:hypothetical protein